MVIERPGRLLTTVLCVLVCAAALSACSGTSSPPPSTTTTTAATSSSLPPLTTSTAEIKHAYAILFDLANPAIPPKLAVVQDGSTLEAAFTAAIHSALAKEAAGASVSSVKIEQGAGCSNAALPSPCAKVVYDILGPNKKPVLTGSSGAAVYQTSKWLVAKSTICGLLALENGGTPPSGC